MCYWCARVQKFHSASVYDQPFLIYRPFWDKCTEWPQNDLKPYKVKDINIPIYLLLVSASPKFHPFSSNTRCCWVASHFEKKAPNDLTPYKDKCTPKMCYQYSRVPNINPFRCTASHFWVTGHFEKSAPNDPKMTLNTTSSNYPICVTCVPDSQISLRFALRPSVLRYRAFWDKCTEWTQNDLEPYKVKWGSTPIYMYNSYPRVSNLTPFRSTTSLFNIQAILRQVHRMTPNWPWTLQDQITL